MMRFSHTNDSWLTMLDKNNVFENIHVGIANEISRNGAIYSTNFNYE
jgi:hypothetical protein